MVMSYSLRSLLIAITAVAIALCWVGYEYRGFRREYLACQELKRSGNNALTVTELGANGLARPQFGFQNLSRGRLHEPVVKVSLLGGVIDEAVCRSLARLGNLRDIELIGCDMVYGGAIVSANAPLRRVCVEDTNLSTSQLDHLLRDRPVEELSLFRVHRPPLSGALRDESILTQLCRPPSLPRLRSLKLIGISLTADALDGIAARKTLAHLMLVDCDASRGSILRFRGASALSSLTAKSSVIQDATFQDGVFPHLRELTLFDSSITDDGMMGIAKSKNLSTLYIDSREITDAGVLHLTGHPALQEIEFRRVVLSERSIEVFNTIPTLEWSSLKIPMKGELVNAAQAAKREKAH